MTSGVYVAHHRWLDFDFGPNALYKVGFSTNLAARLSDGAYVTCFPAGWRFIAVFACAEAAKLEAAALHCLAARRVDSRELVRATLEEIVGTVAAAADRLGIAVSRDPLISGACERARACASACESACACASACESACESACAPASVRLLTKDDLRLLGELCVGEITANARADGEADDCEADDCEAEGGESDVEEAENGGADDCDAENGSADDCEADGEESDDGDADDCEADGEEADAGGRRPAGAADEIGENDLAFAAAAGDCEEARPGLESREYQAEAAAACIRELRSDGRAILQMACRCGKTAVAYAVISDYIANGESAIYYVPGLFLLRQTAQKLYAYGLRAPLLLIGSDTRPVHTDRPVSMTTDPTAIRLFCEAGGPRVVICTYQSSALCAGAFALSIYDEAHRVCGGSAARPFNFAVSARRAGARLFVTATPAYDKTQITMRDRATFGGVAYRYHLRRGIEAGYVNDFRLELVVADAGAGAAEQVVAAMGMVDRLLVFCSNIAHAVKLCAEVASVMRGSACAPFECLVAHSRQPGGGAAALGAFVAAQRAALFNCRLFQEGVEIPSLNGVFYAAPRHSPRDIIQSLCRPLNAAPGKPQSVVFIPVTSDQHIAHDHVDNLKRYASLIPFIDALLDEDPALYEHLLDPVRNPYPVGAIGVRSLGRAVDAAALLASVRRVVRRGASARGSPSDRLMRAANIPWHIVITELRRLATTCRRYPKTDEIVSLAPGATMKFHAVYKHYVELYAQPGGLEPYQREALESLPGWETFGAAGGTPYPWAPAMAFLERWLEEHNGVPPMLDINFGGYVGFDSTEMERLAGALLGVNQQDHTKKTSSGIKNTEHAADLDRICARFGITWRRTRDALGAYVEGSAPTFIQDSLRRFRQHYAEHGSSSEYIRSWFPGYPLKHKAQEHPDTARGDVPQRAARSRRGARGRSGAAGPLRRARADVLVAR